MDSKCEPNGHVIKINPDRANVIFRFPIPCRTLKCELKKSTINYGLVAPLDFFRTLPSGIHPVCSSIRNPPSGLGAHQALLSGLE